MAPRPSPETPLRAPGGALAAAALVALAFLAYLPALSAGFVWDDVVVADNELLGSWRGLLRIWIEPSAQEWEAHYWPLTYTSFWIEHRLFGVSAAVHHATNVALHALNGVLAWWVLRRLGARGACVAAALFAVHPVHVESVAWIVERKDVLSCAFFLAALGAYLRYDERRGGPGARASWALAALAFTAAMLSKSVAIAFPVAALLCVWWRRGRLGRAELLPLVPLFALAAGIAFLDVRFASGRDPESFDFTLLERAALAGRAVWTYLAKLAWPAELAVSYPRWEVGTGLRLLWPASVAAVLAGLWLARRRVGRAPFALAFFYAFALGPTLGFFDYYFLLYSFVADRFQYLASLAPLVGVAALGALVVERAPLEPVPRRAVAGVLTLLVLVPLTWRCHRQAAVWRDDETLFRATLEVHPGAWMAWTNLGNAFESAGRHEEALEAHRRSLEIRPDHAEGHYNLSLSLNSLGRHEEALASLERALELQPLYPKALNNVGFTLDQLERHDEAAQSYLRALELDPDNYEALYNLGNALGALERYEEAVEVFARAEAADPGSLDAPYMRAYCLQSLERHAEALELYLEVLERDPDYGYGHNNIGYCYEQLGRWSEALEWYERALALSGETATVLYNLGYMEMKTERWDDALAHMERAHELQPEWIDPYYMRGECLEALGRVEEAEAVYEGVLAQQPGYHWASTRLRALRGEEPAEEGG